MSELHTLWVSIKDIFIRESESVSEPICTYICDVAPTR
jgi:hypothetical protein